MKKIVGWLMVLTGACGVMAQSQVELMEANPWDSNMTHQVVWETTPGVRYELQESGSLATNWNTLSGYPTQAVQYADAHAFNISSNAGNARFFKVVEYDEQPPAVTDIFPGDGAFAVTRYNTVISASLSDASGIDTNSIQMFVGELGTFTLSDSQLTYTDGLLVFDNGGDTALGYYGTNVQVSLVAADVNGYVGTNSWSFDMEREPDVTTNLFVFGSPDAQRAGQEIGNIPTRVLAERLAGGPIRMSGADLWEIDEVNQSGIILAYTGATAPAFNTGDYVANLTPAHVNEIFYRRITGTYDDPVAQKLVLFTEDVPLTDMVEEGSTSITDGSMILEVSTNGTITAARAAQKAWGLPDTTILLPRIGYSLDGQAFTESGLSITAEQCHFWLDPSLEVGLDVSWGEVKRFMAVAHGDVETALIGDISVQAGASVNETIYDLPTSLQPKTIVTLGSIATIPIFAEVGFDLSLDADVAAAAPLNFRAGFSQDMDVDFGLIYENGESEWIKNFDPLDPEIEPFNSSVNGEMTLGLTLRPVIYVVVLDPIGQGCAGLETGPAVRGGIRFETEASTLAGYLEAKADWELGTRGWAFALFNYPSFGPWNVWEMNDIKLFPEDANLDITDHPDDLTREVGSSATFSVSASASQPISYQWFQDNQIQWGKTGRTLTRSPVSYSHEGSYKVRVRSGSEERWSSTADLDVISSIPSGMAYIPGGTFNMGDSKGDGYSDELPVHSVYVSGFYMSKTEITKAQWDDVYNWAITHGYRFDRAGSGKASSHPVQTVSWYDCVKWCNARSEKEGKTPCYTVGGNVYRTGQSAPDCNWSATGYRLPTEAEWEKAARGGFSGRRFPWGDTITHSQANYYSYWSGGVPFYSYDVNSTSGFHPSYDDGGYPYTSPAGSFSANGYGLYDMAGNVWEWCWDWYDSGYYASSPSSNPRGPSSGSYRVGRGGGGSSYAFICRTAFRNYYAPDYAFYYIGFRVVLP